MMLTLKTSKLELEITEDGVKGKVNSDVIKGDIDATWEDLNIAFDLVSGMVRRGPVPRKAMSHMTAVQSSDA